MFSFQMFGNNATINQTQITEYDIFLATAGVKNMCDSFDNLSQNLVRYFSFNSFKVHIILFCIYNFAINIL